ncbi:FAD-dependent oxidoreductase [Weissella viridescens]|uniref:FAD-dependent oxidoreductase n=1 Tax=Weissella viridescens TaxID=1629 RepID=UPI001D06CDB8|nr:FAD-dependent oxidoreductase [Weissella viridescens]MCB6840603.1 FAD-dependent oxidoreductase [Weissella viridescens]MCB6847289.1 FAD-dependent oxidoreductase [Weissella viridescens]
MNSNKQTELLIIGGSDAGISTALRARELNSDIRITIILADQYPNLSICGIPYAISKEVPQWENLAHRTLGDLEAYDLQFEMNTIVSKIDSDKQLVYASDSQGVESVFHYEDLMVGTGARPKTIPVEGDHKGVHVLRTMDDFFSIEDQLKDTQTQSVAIIGAGYVGLEVAEAITCLGLSATVYQRGSEVLSTVEPEMGLIVHNELIEHGVEVVTNAKTNKITNVDGKYYIQNDNEKLHSQPYDMVICVIGVVPNSELLIDAGASVDSDSNAVIVNDAMQTNLQHVFAAGDLATTKHRLLGNTYLPLGTTSHKQGRVAGANIVGKKSTFAGIVGSQVLRVFNLIVARTGILPTEAALADYNPISVTHVVDDHKGYFPGAQQITITLTADEETHKIIGAQLLGHESSEIAKRTDIFATAIYNQMTIEDFSDLDLTYSPVVGAPWDAVQAVAQMLEKKLK